MYERIIPRQEITQETYREILDKETHHDHLIIRDEMGTLRWQENPAVSKWVDELGLNGIVILFYHLGYGKNSEPYRKLYRDIGYSLSGYWEIFYWEANNPESDLYQPQSLI